jgi:protein-arginine deiminase
MIPKPFGPWIEDNTNPNHGYDLFERDLTQKIAAIVNGPTCDFIDDWDDYHVALGEIHCGTNELRTPYDGQAAFGNVRYANWWTAVDA